MDKINFYFKLKQFLFFA